MLLTASDSAGVVYLQQLRWHHWSKNLLVFMPMIAAQRFYEPDVLLPAVIGFLGMCAAASSVYLLNDLIDLRHDRLHPVKRARPLASGRLPIGHAVAMLPLLWAVAGMASVALPAAYLGVLMAYLALMVVYSLWLKRLRFIDAFALGSGYVLRLAAGAAAADVGFSPTLGAWCLLMFAGFALLKRYAELTAHPGTGVQDGGRSYRVDDLGLLWRSGRLLGALSLLPLALYPVLEGTGHSWSAWMICLLLGVWMRGVWRAAAASRIIGDPVTYVLHDRGSRALGVAIASLLLVLGAPAARAAPAPSDAGAGWEEGIVQLQPYRRIERVQRPDGGDAATTLELVNLNPSVNAWFLLSMQDPKGRRSSFHLENADPAAQAVSLRPGAVLELSRGGVRIACSLDTAPGAELDRARRSELPYAPLCGGRLYLRNAVRGSRTSLEATAQFLRDHVWRGEEIVGFVRREFFRDAFLERSVAPGEPAETMAQGAPPAAGTRASTGAAILPGNLGLELEGDGQAIVPGRWHAVRDAAAVFVSAIRPVDVLDARAGDWRPDPVEADALAYLVAFDLSRFDVGFALGNEHPRLGWSPRVVESMRRPGSPGPDGIDSASPLVRVGMVSPAVAARTVATFTGGFKREHGAFRHGALATRNDGSHYGFIEHGVVFSRLVPGLSTLYVLDDGTVDIKTWRDGDASLQPRIVHARQNGVPLVEWNAERGRAVPGALVGQWGAGNWSGSADERLRSLRAGACIVDTGSTRYLVYGYFSAAVPATMARIFQAYGCRAAMHLDMNALEHTYLAIYAREGNRMTISHLVRGMSEVDRQSAAGPVPRFIGFPDDRDFFYLLRRQP